MNKQESNLPKIVITAISTLIVFMLFEVFAVDYLYQALLELPESKYRYIEILLIFYALLLVVSSLMSLIVKRDIYPIFIASIISLMFPILIIAGDSDSILLYLLNNSFYIWIIGLSLYFITFGGLSYEKNTKNKQKSKKSKKI